MCLQDGNHNCSCLVPGSHSTCCCPPLTLLCAGCSAVTENTRASYPIEYIDNARIPCMGPHPKNLILLCCDAFGVLPPVSRLTREQAMYHFISGYTAKVGLAGVWAQTAQSLLAPFSGYLHMSVWLREPCELLRCIIGHTAEVSGWRLGWCGSLQHKPLPSISGHHARVGGRQIHHCRELACLIERGEQAISHCLGSRSAA